MKTNPVLLGGRWTAAALGFIVLAGSLSAPERALSATVIRDVTVVDARHGAREDQDVVIEGDRIVRIGAAGLELAPGADEVEANGLTLIPGLWDMHVHFLYDPRLTEHMADLFLDYGITSVRDTGGDLAQMIALRREFLADDRPQPHLKIAGPLLDGALVVYDGSRDSTPALGVANLRAGAAANRVRTMAAAGADFIKVYELVSPEVFAALVETARELELPIDSHVPLSMTADTAGPQVDSMEHLRNVELACASNWRDLLHERRAVLDDWAGSGYELRRSLHSAQRAGAIARFDPSRCGEVLAALTETTQVPTLRLNTMPALRPWLRAAWQAGESRLPEAVATRWRSQIKGFGQASDASETFADWSLSLVGRMHKAGVPIGAGTDTPIGFGIPGESLHAELELLVRSGLSTKEALYAATIRPAAFFGMTDVGTIAAGQRADLLLLRESPLEDISNTRSIERVMLDGRWVR